MYGGMQCAGPLSMSRIRRASSDLTQVEKGRADVAWMLNNVPRETEATASEYKFQIRWFRVRFEHRWFESTLPRSIVSLLYRFCRIEREIASSKRTEQDPLQMHNSIRCVNFRAVRTLPAHNNCN